MKESKIQDYITKSGLSCNLVFLSEVDSTNDFAKKNVISPPSVIISPFQKKGRGRLNNRWYSEPEKNITMTIVPDRIRSEKDFCIVNYYAGVVIYNVLANEYPELKVALKWPNDIMINGKKAGGILTEVVKRKDFNDSSLIIGIGLNVNQEEFPEELKSIKYKSRNPTSILLESGKQSELEDLAYKIIKEFFVFFDAIYCPERILYLWKKFSELVGKEVEFIKTDNNEAFKGKVLDIECDGAIVLLNDSGEKFKFFSGEVHLIY
ncbi:MAG: biotin--[acetyl-CoA-carboxylase] ligase [Ignavibacteria bacterium]|nr:biotin--[acetyl-CoA-carboxylase] ligase [Ignavibacteria bacterium]